MKKILVLLLFLLIAGAAAFFLLMPRSKQPPISSNEVRAMWRETLPDSVNDQVWDEAPLFQANLLLQDIVEPRLMKPSTAQVRVQSVTNGREVAFLLRWDDPTVNDRPGTGRFPDAVAVQLPSVQGADVPAPQMGEEGRTVEITYWSSFWQSSVNGRKDEIQEIYPRATSDHYPFDAPSLQNNQAEQAAMSKRYAPARALGNMMSGPRQQPVQDLVAEGPGTLRPADKTSSTGSGSRAGESWNVLIVRALPDALRSTQRSQVAFAVWQGSNEEVGAKKMRTAWVPFTMENKQ